MSNAAHDDQKLIPPPQAVRIELARSVREARRLRSLLRLSVLAAEDRRFIGSLSQSLGAATGRGVAHAD